MALELILISSSNVIHSDPFDEQRRRSKLSCDSTPHVSLGNDEAHQAGSFFYSPYAAGRVAFSLMFLIAVNRSICCCVENILTNDFGRSNGGCVNACGSI